MTIISTTVGKNPLERNGVALIVNKRLWNAVLGAASKTTEWSLHFQGKPFNITVIQVYALTSNAEEAEVKWFYEDVEDLLEGTSRKMSFSSKGFNSVQSLSHVRLFATPWTGLHIMPLCPPPAPGDYTSMSIELVMPSNHLILCHPLLLQPSIFPKIRVFLNESALRIKWPKY